jgi:hypothetical protein
MIWKNIVKGPKKFELCIQEIVQSSGVKLILIDYIQCGVIMMPVVTNPVQVCPIHPVRRIMSEAVTKIQI